MNEIRSLIDLLLYKTKEYDEGKPTISDKEWDDLYFKLVDLENKTGIIYPDSPTQLINYDIVNELKKVKHNHKMLSLAKTKDWDEFINYFGNKDAVCMLKMDGLTCSLEYKNGILIKAETRGNGEIGEDILHNAKAVKSIPIEIPYKEKLVIDGEIICKISDFKNFSSDYSNPRNFAAGSIRLLNAKESFMRNLTFVAWDVIDGFNSENSFLSKLRKIEKLGFTIVPWTSGFDFDAKDFLISKASEYDYPIDGLIGRFDDVSYGKSLGETSHHQKAAFAFKFYDDEYETTLKSIEWTLGRTNVLTPIAVFEPIEIEGAIVERASLHNYSVFKKTLGKPYVGQALKVYRANMIIPQISFAEKKESSEELEWIELPDECPICGKKLYTEYSDSGIENLVCTNPLCNGKFINRLEHFCGKKGLDIKGISKATLEKLVSWSWVNNFEDLFNLKEHRKEWISKEGFGEKSVDKILESIEKSKRVSDASFLTALGIPLIGASVSKDLMKVFVNYSGLRKNIDNEYDFTKLNGFAESKNFSLHNFDFTEADNIYYKYLDHVFKEEEKEERKNNLDGITFVITGKLLEFKKRDELKEKIESFGGKVTNSISKNTDYLINNDISSNSQKNCRAKELNIPIITEREFIDKFF